MQIFALIGCAEKPDRDAEPFAEGMQKEEQTLYAFSTKPDTDKHGYDGLTQILPAAEVAHLISFHPPNLPNLRSILGLQKNGADAEPRAVIRAVLRADDNADTRAEPRAETFADSRAVACADARAVVGAERFAESRAEKIPHFQVTLP